MNSFTDLIQIDKDIINKVVLCAGKDANSISNWALTQGAANVIVVLSANDVDDMFDIPDGIEYVDTVIARNFFTKLATNEISYNFVGALKRAKTNAWYIEVADNSELLDEIEATGKFGYLMTFTDFNNIFRMQLDDGII